MQPSCGPRFYVSICNGAPQKAFLRMLTNQVCSSVQSDPVLDFPPVPRFVACLLFSDCMSPPPTIDRPCTQCPRCLHVVWLTCYPCHEPCLSKEPAYAQTSCGSSTAPLHDLPITSTGTIVITRRYSDPEKLIQVIAPPWRAEMREWKYLRTPQKLVHQAKTRFSHFSCTPHVEIFLHPFPLLFFSPLFKCN